MTNEERKVIELALEALEEAWYHVGTFQPTEKAIDLYDEARTAIKEALAQPEQSNTCGEPDWKGLVLSHNEDCESRCDMDRCGYKPYYEYSKRRCPDCPVHEKIWVDDTTPPQRKPLTRERLVAMAEAQCGLERTFEDWVELFAREIEAAHGIKE